MSSAVITNSDGNSSNFTLPFTNISNFVSLKLDNTKFILWRDQFEYVLIPTDLYGHVHGEIQEPEEIIMNNGVLSLNLRWVYWRKMDRFVISFLKATFTSTISVDVLGLTTTREIWDFLESSFKTQYRARKNMLRAQLFGMKKGNLNVLVYLQKIKTIAYSLAAIGENISDSDLIMHVINSLGREYDNFVISVQNRDTPYTFGELKARFLTHEQWLYDQERDTSTSFYVTNTSGLYARGGNISSRNSYSNHSNVNKKKNGSNFYLCNRWKYGRGNGNRNNGSTYHTGSTSYGSQGNTDTRNGSTSTGESRRFDLSQVDCQICRKKIHYASRCHFRYYPPINSGFVSVSESQQPENSNTNVSSAPQAFASHHTNSVHISDDPSSSTLWLSDSGASTHMTGDSSLLQYTSTYKGKEAVKIGNGRNI